MHFPRENLASQKWQLFVISMTLQFFLTAWYLRADHWLMEEIPHVVSSRKNRRAYSTCKICNHYLLGGEKERCCFGDCSDLLTFERNCCCKKRRYCFYTVDGQIAPQKTWVNGFRTITGLMSEQFGVRFMHTTLAQTVCCFRSIAPDKNNTR